ncbi:hypothetical protein [Nonomuraea glycinis]|uniref:hypothetical protein n=1 Tax=Nonomuraea glycinis TaxID=2047744 RepID=UPI0033B71DAD
MVRVMFVLLLLVTACADAESEGLGEPDVRPPSIVAATSEGAVVADNAAEAFYGLDRAGREVWRDSPAYKSGTLAICQARCPDAVFSGSLEAEGPDPAPRTPRGAFTTSDSRVRRVLTARGASDAVIAEGDGAGKGSLRLIRPSGQATRVPVDDVAGVAWAEDASRTSAVATSGGRVLWFRHDRAGWREVARAGLDGPGVAACTSGGTAVITGEQTHLLTMAGKRTPVATDLETVTGCVAGGTNVAVFAHWQDGAGNRHTGIRGLDGQGRPVWKRDIAAEAQVGAHPFGTAFVIAHGGAVEVVDAAGRTLATHAGAVSAAYTPAGELVLLNASGKISWLPAQPPA